MRIGLPLLCVAALAACDNIGRVFDDGSGDGGGSGVSTSVQAMVIGGTTAEGRPRVRNVFPSGAGWPATVPVVVVFNESVNADAIVPPQGGGNPTLLLRARNDQGNVINVAVAYDFLLGESVVVLRPLQALLTNGTEYEVVIDPEARDIDGIRFGGTEPKVIGSFTPNQDAAQVDGRIVTVLPVDNVRDQQRETPIYAIFDRPVVATTVDTANFSVRDASGAPIAGSLSFPLQLAIGGDDGRVLRFDATSPVLPAAADVQIVVNDTIGFAMDGRLQFGGRSPVATFGTLAFDAPQSVAVGNASPGFPDKVNRTNLESLRVDVALNATAAAGDEVIVRLYGLDPQTTPADDINFVERRAAAAASGAQTVGVDFSAALGTLAKPRFADGSLTLAAQVRRGSRRSGFILANPANGARLDVTPPQVVSVGPPTGAAPTDYVTDQEFAALFGTANERITEATLTAGASMVNLFAGAASGSFVMRPLLLGRTAAALPFQLTVTDAAGNLATASFNGTISQRGAITGPVAGTVVVEAYDDTTLRPIAGATVLLEPGLPTKPPTGRLSAVTGVDGRATFTGLTAPSHSITVVATGFDLRTLLDAPIGFASLPLRPAAATATFGGRLVFQPTPGATGLFGSNLFDDRLVQSVSTSTQAPNDVPPVAIRPNRPHLATGFSGLFEPMSVPSFTASGCSMCGTDGLTPTAPLSATAVGAAASANLALLPATTIPLAATYLLDFALAAGLDTANLEARPNVRLVGGLRGFPGMPLFGVGFASPGSGASFTINGSLSLGQVLALAAFTPVLWVSTQARDTSGNVSRHRRLIIDNTLGVTFPTVAPPGIPTVTPPGAASSGSPAVTYQDRIDASALLGGVGVTELIATDGAGRRWSVLRVDTDAATGDVTVQLPDLAGTGLVGLATGTWTIRAESTLFLSVTMTSGDFMLEEMRRQEVTWARAAPQSFTVN